MFVIKLKPKLVTIISWKHIKKCSVDIIRRCIRVIRVMRYFYSLFEGKSVNCVWIFMTTQLQKARQYSRINLWRCQVYAGEHLDRLGDMDGEQIWVTRYSSFSYKLVNILGSFDNNGYSPWCTFILAAFSLTLPEVLCWNQSDIYYAVMTF